MLNHKLHFSVVSENKKNKTLQLKFNPSRSYSELEARTWLSSSVNKVQGDSEIDLSGWRNRWGRPWYTEKMVKTKQMMQQILKEPKHTQTKKDAGINRKEVVLCWQGVVWIFYLAPGKYLSLHFRSTKNITVTQNMVYKVLEHMSKYKTL